jgi:hypothetical protein
MATPRGKNLVRKVDSEKNEWQWIGGTHRSRVLASEFRWDAVSAGITRIFFTYLLRCIYFKRAYILLISSNFL